MRIFLLKYSNQSTLVTIEELRNFISTAVFRNKDIQTFMVTELDSRLTSMQAIAIASEFDLADEVFREIAKGEVPYNALLEWIK